MDIPSLYCEQIHNSTQILNILSNAIFILVWLYYIKNYRKTKVLAIYGILVLLVWVWSILWHGLENSIWDLIDTYSILILIVFILYYFLSKIFWNKLLNILMIFSVVWVGFVLERLEYLNWWIVYIRVLLVISLFMYIVLQKFALRYSLFFIWIALFLVWIVARSVDILTCSILTIWSHYLWHIFVALSLYYIWKYIRSIEWLVLNI